MVGLHTSHSYALVTKELIYFVFARVTPQFALRDSEPSLVLRTQNTFGAGVIKVRFTPYDDGSSSTQVGATEVEQRLAVKVETSEPRQLSQLAHQVVVQLPHSADVFPLVQSYYKVCGSFNLVHINMPTLQLNRQRGMIRLVKCLQLL